MMKKFSLIFCDVLLEGTKLMSHKGEKLYSSNLTVLILLACRVFLFRGLRPIQGPCWCPNRRRVSFVPQDYSDLERIDSPGMLTRNCQSVAGHC